MPATGRDRPLLAVEPEHRRHMDIESLRRLGKRFRLGKHVEKGRKHFSHAGDVEGQRIVVERNAAQKARRDADQVDGVSPFVQARRMIVRIHCHGRGEAGFFRRVRFLWHVGCTRELRHGVEEPLSAI